MPAETRPGAPSSAHPWRTLVVTCLVLLGLALPSAVTATASPRAGATAEQGLGSELLRGQTLLPDQYLTSPSGRYRFDASSGYVRLLKGSGFLGSTPYERQFAPSRTSVSRLVLQTDGNLVGYGDADQVGFQTATAGQAVQRLVVQDDGNVVLYGPPGQVVHAFGTTAPGELQQLDTLLPGDRLTSPDGGTQLVMQRDGNLVLYTGGTARWASGTTAPGSAALMQLDGNLVVYRPDLTPAWSSGTGVAARNASWLQVVDREVRVLGYASSSSAPMARWGAAWTSSTLEPGMTMVPGDRRVAGATVAVLQADGNLVVYAAGCPPRQSQTLGPDRLVMQTDGNLVLYLTVDDHLPLVPARYTSTAGHPGSRMVVQADGNLVVYDPQDRPLYSLPNRTTPFLH